MADPAKNASFLKATPAQQHAFLMQTEPNFAKATPEQQTAYLNHLTGGAYSRPPITKSKESPEYTMTPGRYAAGVGRMLMDPDLNPFIEAGGALLGEAAAEAVPLERLGKTLWRGMGEIDITKPFKAITRIPEIWESTSPESLSMEATQAAARKGLASKIPTSGPRSVGAGAQPGHVPIMRAPGGSKLMPESVKPATDIGGSAFSETKGGLRTRLMGGGETPEGIKIGQARGIIKPGDLVIPKEAQIETAGPRTAAQHARLMREAPGAPPTVSGGAPVMERRAAAGVSPTGVERRVAPDIGKWQPPPQLGAFSAEDVGAAARGAKPGVSKWRIMGPEGEIIKEEEEIPATSKRD